ncbi:GNAT family N-acetyltransferase [bacterium]|nr:GNAT family N-acetyltransferase [bacterium]
MCPRVEDLVLRPERETDVPFLQELYASTRADELAQVDWPEEQKSDFLLQQFQAQREHYLKAYSDDEFSIIEFNGKPVGRLYLGRWPSEVRVIDIALLPSFRGMGLGGGLMGNILSEARDAGKPVRIHVEKFNPALHLYERLGFQVLEDKGVYLLMEWSADAVS